VNCKRALSSLKLVERDLQILYGFGVAIFNIPFLLIATGSGVINRCLHVNDWVCFHVIRREVTGSSSWKNCRIWCLHIDCILQDQLLRILAFYPERIEGIV
jgi:hypothetical protein